MPTFVSREGSDQEADGQVCLLPGSGGTNRQDCTMDASSEQHVGPPRLGIRRWGDGCFHPVEEEVPEGYIVDGILICRDEVLQVVDLDSGTITQFTRTAIRSTDRGKPKKKP